jgi:hypothetical protein
MDKKFSGNQWFTVNNNTKPVYEDPVEQNNNVAFNKEPLEEDYMADPEALEGRFVQMIEDLEPAQDVREAYKDCIDGNCDPARLANIVDHHISAGNLSPEEGYFIMTGSNPGDQGSRPDVSPRDRELQRRANLGSAYRPDEEDLDFGARDRD